MSKPVSKKAIGGFVLGAIALLIVGVVIFGAGKIFKKSFPVVFYFEGSVKGLNIGSPLMIRGVQVGSVTSIELQFDRRDLSVHIPVHADFDPEKIAESGGARIPPGKRHAELKRMIEQGLRAQLQVQSLLTGLLMINLDFLPDTPVRLAGKDPKELEIPTVPTTMEELTRRLDKLPIEEILGKVASAAEGIQKVVNSPEMGAGMKSLARSLEEMQKLVIHISGEVKPMAVSIHETMEDTRSMIKNADTRITRVSSHLESLMGDARNLVQNADRQVGPLASRLEGTLDEAKAIVGEVRAEVGPLVTDLRKTLDEVRSALVRAQKTLQAAEGNYAEGSALYYELIETLQGLNEASQSIQLLGEYLKRHPDSVIWGKPGGK